MNKTKLYHLFHEASTKFSDYNCVTHVSENRQSAVSYGEMKCIVEEFCCWWKAVGIQTNEFVGILVEELEIEVIAILIGVMEMCNPFVFIDPSSNCITDVIQRLNIRYFIVKETNIQKQLDPSLSLFSCVNVTGFSARFNLWKCGTQPTPTPNSVRTADMAFAVFSSGSTGTPKIIQVPHLCFLPNIFDLRKIYQLRPTDTVFSCTAPTFDPCILDIFLAFSAGSSLLLVAGNIKYDQHYLSRILNERVTVLYTTPSLFMKAFPKNLNCTNLKILILGGEPFPKLDAKDWPFLKEVQVYNIYGITEVSCWASVELVIDFEDVSLGMPLTDTIFQVRNNEGAVIGEGEGELFIGSERRICIVNDEDFSVHNGPYFRATGDIVKFSNNKYYFIGRKDRRIKLYGYLIDLSLIEMKALRYMPVKRCCSVFIPEEKKIAVLVESHANDDVNVEGLESYLKAELTASILPGNIFKVPEIPLNKHGKVCHESCLNLYYHLKRKSVDNVFSEFRSLWIKFTKNSDHKFNESHGFLSSGGNSMLALQFSEAVSCICTQSNDFIVALLSNKNYNDCLKFLVKRTAQKTQLISTDVGNSVDRTTEKSKHVDHISKVPDGLCPKKRPKMTAESRLLRAHCKGKTTVFSELENHHEELKGYATIQEKWKHNLGKCVDASPSLLVFEDRSLVACGSHSGHLLLVDVQTGVVHCEFTLPDRIESSACSSETGRFIYVGCYDHKLYCCNIEQSLVEWSFRTGDIIKTTPVYQGERIYFGSYDHNFYCLSCSDGSLIWKVNIDRSSIYASAVIKEKVIIIVTLGGTVAFVSHDGKMRHKFSGGKPFFSSPCNLNNDLCLVIDVTGALRLFSSESFLQLWQYQVTGNVFSSATAVCYPNQRVIFGCHDKSVYCFEISTDSGVLCWRTEVDSSIFSSPFCCRFVNAESNALAFLVTIVTTSGTLLILNSLNGDILKTYCINHPVFSSPVVSNSNIIVGSRDDNLYCLEAS